MTASSFETTSTRLLKINAAPRIALFPGFHIAAKKESSSSWSSSSTWIRTNRLSRSIYVKRHRRVFSTESSTKLKRLAEQLELQFAKVLRDSRFDFSPSLERFVPFLGLNLSLRLPKLPSIKAHTSRHSHFIAIKANHLCTFSFFAFDCRERTLDRSMELK